MDSGVVSYRRFLAGDDTGIVEIIRDYKDGLILYLNSFTHNIYTAEELMEETFVKLVTRRPRFSGRSSFKTWLYTIGRNAAIDWLRKNARISTLTRVTTAEVESLEEAYLKQERKITLHRAIRKLNPQYQQVLYLLYFEGFDNAGAAQVMKKNKRQIENLVYRAKQALKAELEKEGFHDEEL